MKNIVFNRNRGLFSVTIIAIIVRSLNYLGLQYNTNTMAIRSSALIADAVRSVRMFIVK